MKTAGSILSSLFDEGFMKKAQGFSKLFDSWADITAKNKIAAAADHSRIKDLDDGLLLIEVDHPGWKQILQTKQEKLLYDFRYRFPDLNISGIALKLSSNNEDIKQEHIESAVQSFENLDKNEEKLITITRDNKGIEDIKDEDFKDRLKKLEQTITDREKN